MAFESVQATQVDAVVVTFPFVEVVVEVKNPFVVHVPLHAVPNDAHPTHAPS